MRRTCEKITQCSPQQSNNKVIICHKSNPGQSHAVPIEILKKHKQYETSVSGTVCQSVWAWLLSSLVWWHDVLDGPETQSKLVPHRYLTSTEHSYKQWGRVTWQDLKWQGLPQDGGAPQRSVWEVLREGMQRGASEDVVVSRQRRDHGRVSLKPHAWKRVPYLAVFKYNPYLKKKENEGHVVQKLWVNDQLLICC